MIQNIGKYVRFILFKHKFRILNSHNETVADNYFPLDKVLIGNKTYGPLKIVWMTSDNAARVKIGNYCSIGPEVTFLVGGEHNYRRISTWPFQTKVYHQKNRNHMNNSIIVEDDVWIGYDALILSGVTIGKGSVIGARAI